MSDEQSAAVAELSPVHFAVDTLGKGLLQAMVDEIKNAPDAWAKMSYGQQDQCIERLRVVVRNLVGAGLDALLRGQYPACQATLDSIMIKDGVGVRLTIERSSKTWHELADAVGSRVLLVIADPDQYTERMEEIKGKADQKDLFEAGEEVQTHSERMQSDTGKSYAELMAELGAKIPTDAAFGDELVQMRGAVCEKLDELKFAYEVDALNPYTMAGLHELFVFLVALQAFESFPPSQRFYPDGSFNSLAPSQPVTPDDINLEKRLLKSTFNGTNI